MQTMNEIVIDESTSDATEHAAAIDEVTTDETATLAVPEPEVTVIPMVACTACAVPTPELTLMSIGDSHRLCRGCAARTCRDCGRRDRNDIMARSNPDGVLCSPCCSRYPGREWMRSGLEACDTPAEVVEHIEHILG
jgi:hypothetical protein